LVTTSGGVTIAPPKYNECMKLPQSGKRGYGTCPADQVVVIVNEAQEMTCCPIGKNVLSSVAAEQHVERQGLCGANEVATGMKDPKAPKVYCTKINTTHLKLSPANPAKYYQGGAPGVVGQIAASYNANDTCICDEGTVISGGHTGNDNVCKDQCVRIEKK
jgi:hypothetical protein